MPRSGPSREDARLIEETGISLATLERWRSAGIVPRNERRGLGRGRGSASAARPETAGLVHALRVHARRGRSVHEAVLAVFCGHPRLQLPQAAVSAALSWFDNERGKGLASAIRCAAGPHARAGHAGAGDPKAYDAVIDAVYDVAGKFRTGKHRFPGTPAGDSQIDAVRAAGAFPSLVAGLVLGPGSIGADEYMRATREFSAALGENAILTSQDLAMLGQRLRQAERTGKPIATGPAGQPLLACQPISQVPVERACQVRDQLTIIAEAAAIAAMIEASTAESPAAAVQDEPAVRALGHIRAHIPAARAYLLFPPPLCTDEPSQAWKQMTHFIVRTCTYPGAPAALAMAAEAVAPILGPLRELAGRARASVTAQERG